MKPLRLKGLIRPLGALKGPEEPYYKALRGLIKALQALISWGIELEGFWRIFGLTYNWISFIQPGFNKSQLGPSVVGSALCLKPLHT